MARGSAFWREHAGGHSRDPLGLARDSNAMASGAVSCSPGASQPRATSRGAPADVHMSLREVEPRSIASSREGFLVFVHNVEDLLQPPHMRPLLTCSRATFCLSPRTEWTEDVPICSSPFCKARTGLWLPCRKEIKRITNRPGTYPCEYMCAKDEWGSLTLRSVIEDMKHGVRATWDHRGKVRTGGRGLVACSLACGKDLREIARIQKMGDYVLLASHHRLLPEASITECFQDERYLLQSEIAFRRNAAIGAQAISDQSVAIHAQASHTRDQGPSPDGVADDYAAADRTYFAVGQTTASVYRMAGVEN